MDTKQFKVLVCARHPETLTTIAEICEEIGAICESATPQTLAVRAAGPGVSCLLVEIDGVGNESTALLEQCRRSAPGIPCIALLAGASPNDASRLRRLGAFDCFDPSAQGEQFLQAVLSVKEQISPGRQPSEPWRQHLVGQSPSIAQVSKVIRLIAARRCTVLITGETGTGKEMAARAIHSASDRARKAFVAINCGAIPENLIEAELFGHVKGAFTGAVNARIGRFEQANGGTLFLDEIGDMPLDLQAKLLRVLQERELHRLGSGETIKTDVRVIAATNADLLRRVQQGRFREDLFYRLNVVPIHMPPLRERTSDIPLLLEHFVGKVCRAEGIAAKVVSAEVAPALGRHVWPGNVRQLENSVEHAVIMSGDRQYLYPSDFAISRPETAAESDPAIRIPPSIVPASGLNYTEALRDFERAILQQALSQAQGNKTIAAGMLQLPRTTLLHKLRALEQPAA